MVKNTGTKVYFSDKSESSVEDLMDETPSNYNIPNGRLDGKSIGLRFGL
jgi:16S rRNA U516 pseudouridylate synthase RsuA-like enzyme